MLFRSGFYQRTKGDVFIAGVKKHGLLRLVHGADLFILAATGVGLDIAQQRGQLFLSRQSGFLNVLNQTVKGKGIGCHHISKFIT